MRTIKRGLSLSVLALILVSGAVACGRTASPLSSGGGSSATGNGSQSAQTCVRVHLDACWSTYATNVNGGYYVPPSSR